MLIIFIDKIYLFFSVVRLVVVEQNKNLCLKQSSNLMNFTNRHELLFNFYQFRHLPIPLFRY